MINKHTKSNQLRRLLLAPILAVVGFLSVGSFSVSAAHALSPVGGEGFTAVRVLEDGLEIRQVDRYGVAVLLARGYRVAPSVELEVAHSATQVYSRPGTSIPSGTGSGAVVAVLDTGIDVAHPWFAGRVLDGFYTHKDSTDVSKWGVDANGHGTHVAGIVAQTYPDARILPVKIFDDRGYGSDATMAAGIVWAADNGAAVVNISAAIAGRSLAVEQAVQYAVTRNVVVVAASGNDGELGSPASWPAAYPEVLAVAASDSNDSVASFSTRGTYVDVAALGVAVYSSVPGGYAHYSGTSMASPYAAAAAGMLRQARPEWSEAVIRARLAATARDIDVPGVDPASGSGIVDIPAALRSAADYSSAADGAVNAPVLAFSSTAILGGVLLKPSSPVVHFDVVDAFGVSVASAPYDAASNTLRVLSEIPVLVNVTAVAADGTVYAPQQLELRPKTPKTLVASKVKSRTSLRLTARVPKVSKKMQNSDLYVAIYVVKNGNPAKQLARVKVSAARTQTLTATVKASSSKKTFAVCYARPGFQPMFCTVLRPT
jgi:subtilisin family serine protease